MKRLAICLGLTHVDPAAYDGWDGDCPGCDRDAAAIATAVHDRGFRGVAALVNKFVSSRYVSPLFLTTAMGLEAADLLVLYYSGHGGRRPGDEPDGHDETMCWFDGEVVDDLVAEYLRQLAPGVRVLFISDSCHAGDNFKGRRSARSPGAVLLPPKAVEPFRGSLIQFAGCAQDRSSYGADDGGAWTIALLSTLKKARKPLTYQQWFDRAAKRMSQKQRPVLATWGEPDFLGREALT